MSEISVNPGDVVKINNDTDIVYTIEKIERYEISSTGVMIKFEEETLPRILSKGMLIKV